MMKKETNEPADCSCDRCVKAKEYVLAEGPSWACWPLVIHSPFCFRLNIERKRASALADECGLLREQLHDKRAECDKLRDMVTALESALGSARRGER